MTFMGTGCTLTGMKLIGIEPTPNPNSMKLMLDETLAPGVKATYRAGDEVSAPLIRDLLSIAGVAGIFHTSDFMAVQRTPGTDWQEILARVRIVFDAAAGASAEVAVPRTENAAQELLVAMQVFRDIPMQVKVTGGSAEIRRGLGRRFGRGGEAGHAGRPEPVDGAALGRARHALRGRRGGRRQRRGGGPRAVRLGSACMADRSSALHRSG